MASAHTPTGRFSGGATPLSRMLARIWPSLPSSPHRSGLGRRHVLVRVGASLLRIVFALTVLRAVGVLHPGRSVVGHAVVIVVAFMVVAGPWFLRLARNLSFERAARIREQERAE